MMKIVRFFCLFLGMRKMEFIIDINSEIIKGRTEFNNVTFEINSELFFNPNTIENISKLNFEECTFNGEIKITDISKPSFKLLFKKCTFNNNFSTNKINFSSIIFIDTKKITDVIIDGELLIFAFINKTIPTPKLKGEISIWANIKQINLDNLFLSEGTLQLSKKRNSDILNDFSSFKNITVENCLINNYSFQDHIDFKNIKILNELRFTNCDFNNLEFNNADFGKQATVSKCKLLNQISITNFNHKNNLKFTDCTFEKRISFENLKFYSFEINNSTFLEKVSFENFETNYFKIHQVTFAEAAYFDDLNKNNNKAIENWDRKTLRAIKRELVNTHNQIDYLRFKAYELEAFKKEKGKSWKDNAILELNSCSSKNGLDWFRGFLFTIIVSVLFFYLYTTIEVYTFWSNPLDYNFISLERVKEYLFFLNPSNFNYHFDKLKSNKTNITIIVTTIIFVFAKAFIGYGIYQTIQAFRKFGVNGG